MSDRVVMGYVWLSDFHEIDVMINWFSLIMKLIKWLWNWCQEVSLIKWLWNWCLEQIDV